MISTRSPVPTLTDGALSFGKVAKILGSSNNELRYEHFSIVFNADRRFAFFTAVNIDGTKSVKPERGHDSWWYDPRLPEELQIGDELYSFQAFLASYMRTRSTVEEREGAPLGLEARRRKMRERRERDVVEIEA